MAEKSTIQWTDATWNIARGCSKVDADCKYCYMYRQSLNGTRYTPNQVIRTKSVFNLPLKLKEPSRIFASSLTDFFHEDIDSYRNEAWDIIRKCPQHTFQILTKRPERITDFLPEDWGDGWNHVQLGTSIGSQAGIERMFHLMHVKCKTRFLSLEPLHGEIDLSEEWDLSPMNCGATLDEYIHWVIVGGESGNDNGKYKYRPCKLEWIDKIVKDCRERDVPVFVKQMGTYLAKELNLSDRHGGDMNEFPEGLRIREFPIAI
jgi:protein gp37